MKKLLLPVVSLVFLASCQSAPNRDRLKTVFADTCTATARNEMMRNGTNITPELEQMVKDYCECSGEKAVSGLTEEELTAMDKDPNSVPQARIEQLTQPCMEEFMQKMQAQGIQ